MEDYRHSFSSLEDLAGESTHKNSLLGCIKKIFSKIFIKHS